jgi:uncharacterized spore protein YtfJ
MVDIMQTIDSVTRNVQERLTVKTAYGEPISANGVTIVPVARVSFGFGGGGGGGTGNMPAQGNGASAEAEQSMRSGSGGGGGGGGGAMVKPLGFIEINDIGARWVPIEPARTETLLRAITTLAVLGPGGKRSLLPRLVLFMAGQALIGQLMRPQLPPMPDSFSMGRQPAEAPV